MSLGRTYKLNSGYEIPAVGLGTWVRCFQLTSYCATNSFMRNSFPNPTKSRRQLNTLCAVVIVTLMLQHATKMRMRSEMAGRSRACRARRSLWVDQLLQVHSRLCMAANTYSFIFQITSKLWNTHHHPDHVEEGLNQTLKDLQTDYLDLYLVGYLKSKTNKLESFY